MLHVDLDDLAVQLERAHVTCAVRDSGVTFENKQLKLDTEDDAKDVIEAINKCDNVEFLHLGGNTLGVDAAKGIAKALESHPELKRALWMDIFTGRMKTEIPKALHFLGAGLSLSGAQLTELDLSDNAFGPIGMEGLAALLRSSTCYALQVLKLNNNGLGITGGKLLSRALLDCHANSTDAGKSLGLKVFVAGRNRLENDGAMALAQVFQVMGTLQEVCMPQNGIWHKGITALCEAFAVNQDLRVVNLNDNTVREKGAASMVQVLPSLQKLTTLNLGDCLLKTNGALLLADALCEGHTDLQELILASNEINVKGGIALARAMKNKIKLKLLDLDGNNFGKTGCESVVSELTCSGRLKALKSLSEDEGDSGGEDEDEVEERSSDEDDSCTKNSVNVTKLQPPVTLNIPQVPKILGEESPRSTLPQVSVEEFLKEPTADYFMSLGNNRNKLLLDETRKYKMEQYLIQAMPLLMKVSALSCHKAPTVKTASLECSKLLYQEVFRWGQENNQCIPLINCLLVHLGLLKTDDKCFVRTWNLEGCILTLKHILKLNCLPDSAKSTVALFLERQIPTVVATTESVIIT